MYLTVEDGVKIYYEDHGDPDAFPIILMHGWGVSSALWSEQIQPLVESGYRVITLDARGHGKSGSGINGRENLLEVVYEDFRVLMAHLKIYGKFGIIGHSAGGGIGMSICLSNPEDVEFMCILNSSYTLTEYISEKLIWAFVPNLINFGFNPIFRSTYKFLIKQAIPFIAAAINKPVDKVKTWINDILNVRKKVVLTELKHIRKYNLKHKLKYIETPCLIIAGEFDFLTPVSRSKVLHESIPNSEFHIIKGTGHLSKIEKSDEVNNLILDFLKRQETNS